MGKWQKGYQKARIAIPHLRRAKAAAVQVKKNLRKEENKRNPVTRISDFARAVETTANLVLLVLAIVSLFRAFKNNND